MDHQLIAPALALIGTLLVALLGLFGHSLYFDDADQLIVDKYVSALHVVRSAIEQSNDADLKAKYSETGILNAAEILPVVTATDEMEKYRAIIKEKAKKVAGSV